MVTLISGRDLEKSRILEKETGVPYITGASQIQGENIIVNRWTRTASVPSESGDVLLTCKGTVGKVAINNVGKIHIARQIMALRTNDKIENRYLKFYMMSMAKGLNNNAKSMIPGIDRKTVLEMTIPVPPLLEQYRIVAKLNQIFDQISRAEEAYNELTGPLFERFRQLCLQKAIQGKLVPQLENEPKVNRTSISIRNIPFHIPKKWQWCKFSDILEIQNGDRGKNYPSKSKLTTNNTGLPFVSAINLENFQISTRKLLYLQPEQSEKLKSGHIKAGDCLLCIRGSLGKFGFAKHSGGAIASSLVILRLKDDDIILSKYLKIFLQSPLFAAQIQNYQNGTAQPNLSAKDLSNFLVPIPPLTEQDRIAYKFEEIIEALILA